MTVLDSANERHHKSYILSLFYNFYLMFCFCDKELYLKQNILYKMAEILLYQEIQKYLQICEIPRASEKQEDI